MRDILRKDNWKLDGATALVFAACMGTAFQVISDSGEKHADRILSAAGFALSAYVLAFLTGFLIRRFVRVVPSWMWMSGFGALTYAVILGISIIPTTLDYYHRFEESSGISESAYLLQKVPALLMIMAIWAVAGAMFLIMIRCLVQMASSHRLH